METQIARYFRAPAWTKPTIGQRADDDGYYRWFAWHPVRLNWSCEATSGKGKMVWLRFIHRRRTSEGTIYATFEGPKPEYRWDDSD